MTSAWALFGRFDVMSKHHVKIVETCKLVPRSCFSSYKLYSHVFNSKYLLNKTMKLITFVNIMQKGFNEQCTVGSISKALLKYSKSCEPL